MLITGSPSGNISYSEKVYLDGAPNIFYQNYLADPLNNPDADGYYWNMSGTAEYGVKGLGCITDVSFTQNITANDIMCDVEGMQGTIQQRDSVDLKFTLQNPMPLSMFAELNNMSVADVSSGLEKVGIGEMNNNRYWMVYAPKVYDSDSGDYLMIHLHKAQFVDVGDLSMTYGKSWAQSFTVRGFADTTKPAAHRFGTIIRSDLSALP